MEQYIISHQISLGTFGTVYEAHTKETGTKVAVKKVQKKFYEFNQRQRNREAKVLSGICHPNLITLLDFVEKSACLYFIFEYMDLNLYEVTSNQNGKPFPLVTVQSYLRQILLGLEFLHGSGYFHRDIKPENILVTKDIIKICDFGQVYELKEGKKHSKSVSTRWYRSPEVQLGYQYYGSSIDLWAVGAIAAELMTLKPLFPGKSDEDQISVLTTVLGSPSEISFGGTWPLGTQLAKISEIPFLTSSKSIGTILDILRKYVHLNPACTSFVLDLLQYDPSLRLTATQALGHDFFDTTKQSHSLKKIQSHFSESAICSFTPNTGLPEIKLDTRLSFHSNEENLLSQLDVSNSTTQGSTDSLSSPLSIYFGSSSSIDSEKNHGYLNTSSDSLPDHTPDSFSPQHKSEDFFAMEQMYPNNLPLPCLNSSLHKNKSLHNLRVKSFLQLYTSSDDGGKSSFFRPPRSNFSVKTKHLSMVQSDFTDSLEQFIPPAIPNPSGLRRVSNIASSEFTSLRRLSSDFEKCLYPPSSADKSYPSIELTSKYSCTSNEIDNREEYDTFPDFNTTVNRPLNTKNSFLSFVRKVPSIDISFSTARFSNIRNQSKEPKRNSLFFPPTSPIFGTRRIFNSQSVDITTPSSSSSPSLKHQRSRQGSIGSIVGRVKTLLSRKSRPVGPHSDTLLEESSIKEPPPSDLWSSQPS